MRSLDIAAGHLKIFRDASIGNEDTLEKLDSHDKQITDTRDLLSKISFEDRYQTPRVESELPLVGGVVQTLVKDLGGGKPTSLRKVNNDINDLGKVMKNLRQLLPGIYTVAEGNIQDANGLLQANAPVVPVTPDQVEGLTSIARGNHAQGEIQINALFSADGGNLIKDVTKLREKRLQHSGSVVKDVTKLREKNELHESRNK